MNNALRAGAGALVISAAVTGLLLTGAGAATTPHVAADDPISAGRFLVNYGGCNDCHTSGQLEGQPLPPESGRLEGSAVGFMGPWGVSYPPNLRLAVSTMTSAQFTALIANPGPLGKPPMPWPALQSLSQGDQLAIYAYLHSLGPAGTMTPADVPPGGEPTTPYIRFVPVMPGSH